MGCVCYHFLVPLESTEVRLERAPTTRDGTIVRLRTGVGGGVGGRKSVSVIWFGLVWFSIWRSSPLSLYQHGNFTGMIQPHTFSSGLTD